MFLPAHALLVSGRTYNTNHKDHIIAGIWTGEEGGGACGALYTLEWKKVCKVIPGK